MTNASPPPPDRRQLYRAAILEVDHAKLIRRVSDAQLAILDRIEATLAQPRSFEHQEMYDALAGLRVRGRECEDQMRKNVPKDLQNRRLENPSERKAG
jgi:hypothetical protein